MPLFFGAISWTAGTDLHTFSAISAIAQSGECIDIFAVMVFRTLAFQSFPHLQKCSEGNNRDILETQGFYQLTIAVILISGIFRTFIYQHQSVIK